MRRVTQWIDKTAGIGPETPGAAAWLERAAFVCLLLTAAAAPNSIAATQIAWLLGMLLWIVRLFLRPRAPFRPGAIDYLLAAYLAWSVVSAAVSYAPDISFDRLRVVTLFLIFYFAYHNLRTFAAVRAVAGTLIAAAMAPALFAPLERIPGRGVQVFELGGSAFEQATVADGDTILRVNGRKISSLDELRSAILSGPAAARILVYRLDYELTIDVPLDRLRDGESPDKVLAVGRWQPGRTWRSAGFFGHYTTFAEVLQLVMSLVLGLLIAAFARAETQTRTGFLRPIFLLPCLAATAVALILSATRASQIAFAASAVLMTAVAGSRKLIVAALLTAIPLGLVGIYVIRSSRNVGMFDVSDNSMTWRQTVYREAFGLWTASPRNFVFGVGMDSIKRYAGDWKLFDEGRLPIGHFHSTPIQLAVERGLPALLVWLAFFGSYLRRLLAFLRSGSGPPVATGIVLGAFGGACGFFVGGLVHYNLGDSEVAMLFFLVMGLGLAAVATTVSVPAAVTEPI
jgi:membrane-associated protease RseP (regulator of RpoE activity)